jgi:hypothetical protein
MAMGHTNQRRAPSARPDARHVATLMRRVAHAHEDLCAARGHRDPVSAVRAVTARHHLQLAVDAARDAGVAWSEIGDAVGIARGNAYQQFRRRPSPAAHHGADARAC